MGTIRPYVSGLAVLILLAGGAWGARALLTYQQTPGLSAQAAPIWPASATVSRPKDRPTLLLFAHPQCGCTAATLSEMEQTLKNSFALPDVFVLFARLGDGPEWQSTPLWKSAASLPRARVAWDNDGAEARRFGVHTSGQILLYSADGMLLFNGGVTQARGHAGNNRGRESLELALSRTKPVDAFPVFGCSLLGLTAKGFR